MWLIGAMCAAAFGYCGVYAAFCVKSKAWAAFAVSVMLALVPATVFALCVIFQ